MSAGVEITRRLCSEIQLFDLCSLNNCGKRDGRFCSDQALLLRFEEVCGEDERELAGDLEKYCADDYSGDDDPEGDEWIEEVDDDCSNHDRFYE